MTAKSWKTRKPKSGQDALLSAIWRKYGGMSKVSTALGLGIQTLANWRNRHGVPLDMCPVVMRKLRLNSMQTLGLNYSRIREFDVPSRTAKWEEVVKSFNFAAAEERYILSFPLVNLPQK